MAVVNLKSSLYRNEATNAPLDPVEKAARLIVLTGTVANASADSNQSGYLLAELPSDCILHEMTAIGVANWGFATVNVGTRADKTALITVAKSAGNVVKPVTFGDAGQGKRLWERLGLAADPGGVIGLYLHATANATATGSASFQIAYLFR